MDALEPLFFRIDAPLAIPGTSLHKIWKPQFLTTVSHFVHFLLFLKGPSGALGWLLNLLHAFAQDASWKQIWNPPATVFYDSHTLLHSFHIFPGSLPSSHFVIY